MGTMVIIPVIDDGVYVCICKVFSSFFKKHTQHTFVYDSHFSPSENSECCGAIIDHISYAPIFVLEEKDRKSQTSLKKMVMKFFDGSCIVEYDFKGTENYFL